MLYSPALQKRDFLVPLVVLTTVKHERRGSLDARLVSQYQHSHAFEFHVSPLVFFHRQQDFTQGIIRFDFILHFVPRCSSMLVTCSITWRRLPSQDTDQARPYAL